jgi:recombination protein RecA
MAELSWKREKVGTAIVGRGLEGFQKRPAVEVQPSGVAELDALLGGGFPRGSLIELCGGASSGRTSLAFSLLARATEHQESCSFVDVSDSLDPLSLAAAGVELSRVLWIRCGLGAEQAVGKTSPYLVAAEEKPESPTKKSVHAHGWRHPRELMRGVERAIPSIMGMRSPAGANPELHVIARCAGEQVERDREPPRRGIRPARFVPKTEVSLPEEVRVDTKNMKPWKRLEQALKATDLLLHSGGWGVVVVDLGGISWADARRVNLSMWFRFRRAIENTPTILLLLGEESCAKSCASLVLHCQRKENKWNRAAASARTGAATLEGFEVQGEVTRSRVGWQSADSARWQIRTS